MVAMATQKFVADVATDALQHCKQRQVSMASASLLRVKFHAPSAPTLRLSAPCPSHFLIDTDDDTVRWAKQAGIPASRRATAKDKRFVLTSADLQAALKEQGIGIAKPPYYV
jgi:hypothetical protein